NQSFLYLDPQMKTPAFEITMVNENEGFAVRKDSNTVLVIMFSSQLAYYNGILDYLQTLGYDRTKVIQINNAGCTPLPFVQNFTTNEFIGTWHILGVTDTFGVTCAKFTMTTSKDNKYLERIITSPQNYLNSTLLYAPVQGNEAFY